MKKKIFLSIFILIVLTVIGLLIGFNWQSIKAVFNGQVIYTQEQVDNIKEDTWEEALKQEESYLSQINSYRQLIEQNSITISDLNSQIEILTKQNQEYISKNEELNKTVTTLTGQIENLTKQVEEHTITIEENNTTISALEEEIDELKNDISENQTLINNLNEKIELLQNQNKVLQTTIDNHLVTISTLNVTIDSLNETIENLKNDKNTLQQSINELSSQVSNLEQEIENYKSIIETLQRENFATVIFKIENEVVSTQSIKKGTHPSEIEDERLNDESFKGWVIENTIVVVDPYTYNIENNVTFVAKFEKSYTVTFKVEDSIVDTQLVNAGQYASEYVVSNTEEYVFNYWTVNGVKIEDISTYPINSDTEFVAVLKYYKSVTYQVSGQEDYIIKVLEGNKIEEEYNPTFTKNEYLVGWMLNGDKVDPLSLIINDNVVLIADINYINNSYEVCSLVTLKSENPDIEQTLYRSTFTFNITDNILTSLNLKLQFYSSDWLDCYSFVEIDYFGFSSFDFKNQELKINVPISEILKNEGNEEVYNLLKLKGIEYLVELNLSYENNEWLLKEFSEFVEMFAVAVLESGTNFTFEIGESQIIIKEE